MFKVMIVEDEPVIRNGIAKSIDWECLGCEVIALAENGKEAMEKISRCVPDIVVSDIKMPEMDGLELSDRLLSMFAGIRIILLTGHKEFEYVKQAMKMGVSNYILKPTDPSELEAAIKEVTDEIKSRIQMSSETEKLRDEVKNSKGLLKEKFLYDLMFSPLSISDEVEKKIEYYGVQTKSYWLIGICIDSFVELESYFTEEDINILVFLTKNVLDEMVSNSGFKMVTVIRDRCVYAVVEQENHTRDELKAFLEEICAQVKQQGKFSVSIGVSENYDKIAKLQTARKEVDACLEQRVFRGDNIVIFSDSLSCEQNESSNVVDITGFVSAIERGEDIVGEAKKIQEKIVQSKDANLARSTALEAIVLGVRAYCCNYGKIEDLFDPPVLPLEKIIHSKTLSAITKSFHEIVLQMDEELKDRVSNRYLQAISVVKKHIEENYDQDISLESIASMVYMSQWYLSKVFKRITGRNFISYLTEVRMNKAKEFIAKNPELKNYEIAEKVGFISVRYFSELFKKFFGITPSEYRSKCR
jgi:two-component system, response regulator YesN